MPSSSMDHHHQQQQDHQQPPSLNESKKKKKSSNNQNEKKEKRPLHGYYLDQIRAELRHDTLIFSKNDCTMDIASSSSSSSSSSSVLCGEEDVENQCQQKEDEREEEPKQNEIDLEASFSPKPFLRTFLFKLIIIFGWSLSVMILQIPRRDAPSFYLAYVTSWALIITLLYLLFSVSMTVFPPAFSKNNNNKDDIPLRLKITWALFSMAACMELQVSILYWTDATNSSSVNYITVMTHGGIALLLLLEGLFINRIPIQMKQIIFPWFTILCYILWTIIHSVCDMGNPHNNSNLDSNSYSKDGDDDDDVIYPIVNWEKRLIPTFFVILGILFMTTPLSFLFIRHLSRYQIFTIRHSFCQVHRRYKQTQTQQQQPEKKKKGLCVTSDPEMDTEDFSDSDFSSSLNDDG